MLKFKYLVNESPPQPHNKTEVDGKFDQRKIVCLSIISASLKVICSYNIGNCSFIHHEYIQLSGNVIMQNVKK